jgi:hypothetical protein
MTPKRVGTDQCRDTGMAMVLLVLLGLIRFKWSGLLMAAVVLHVANMIAPRIFRPIVPLWLGLAHALGAISSRVLLATVYWLVVTPVALARQALGKDSLRLRAFKAGDESVMATRRHVFTAGDLEKPY